LLRSTQPKEMIKTQVTAVVLLFSLVFATVTSGRFFQDTDDRDKRQIGDLRTAEYLALITLNKMHRPPSHCADIACGLVDVLASGKRRKRSVDSIFRGLNENQRLNLLDILMSREAAEQLS